MSRAISKKLRRGVELYIFFKTFEWFSLSFTKDENLLEIPQRRLKSLSFHHEEKIRFKNFKVVSSEKTRTPEGISINFFNLSVLVLAADQI